MVLALTTLAGMTLVGFMLYAALRVNQSCGCAIPRHGRPGTRIIMHTVQEALVHYQADHGESCPPSLDALVAEGYLTQTPRDTWGNALMYRCRTPARDPFRIAELISAGPDGHFYTNDDIYDDD